MSAPTSSEQKAEPAQVSKPKICYWDNIAYELREQIFDSIDEIKEPVDLPPPVGSTNYFRRHPSFGPSRMPALVIALRTLPLSYSHVMEWFKKANFHLIHYVSDEQGQDLSDMNQRELEAITSINLIYLMDNPFNMEETDPCSCISTGTDQRKIHLPGRLKQNLSLAVNIKLVYLDFRHYDDHDTMHWLTEFAFCLEGFKSLTRLTVNLPDSIWELGHQQYSRIVEGMVNHVSQKVGVRGELAHTPRHTFTGPSRIYQDGIVKWIWESFLDEIMDFSRPLGRVFKFPQRQSHILSISEEDEILEATWTLRYWNWEVDWELLEQWRRF